MTRTTIPSEHDEQSALMDWIYLTAWKHPELHLFYHIPNEGKRSPAAAMKLKQEGLKAGVPDNFLPVARGEYHGLYIELKRIRGGKVSPEQQQWIGDLNAQGYLAVVCKGWEEAAEVITKYMEMKNDG